MSKQPRRHERKAKVVGISLKEAMERFKYSLLRAFNCKIVEDKGQYVVFHGRIYFRNKSNVDVIIYTTDKIFISATPILRSDEFDKVSTQVINIAQQSVQKLTEIRPVTLKRARSILEFASKLNTDDEFQRMVVVILADTSNEIVLREQMKALKIQGTPLDAGIPEKINYIKKKGNVVYAENEILNVRELRNDIVHYGNIPDKKQTEEALRIALDVLEKA